jgi:multidrug efflux system outer membrane protein
MSKRFKFDGRLGLLMVALAFAGCAVGPNYKQPKVSTPENFRFASAPTTNSFGDLPWWEVFQDPKLQDLIRVALTNNYNIKQAVARVEQARYQVSVARSEFFPQINYSGDLGRGRNSLYNAPAPPAPGSPNFKETSVLTTVGAFWEIDFWGRIRRLNEAARAQYLATDEARRGVTISMMSDLATAYFQLLDLDRELQIQRDATNAYAGSYRIFHDRLVNGVASRLETDRASAALANAAALIPQLEIQVAATENQINVLLGRNPGSVPRSSLAEQSQVAPEIPAGLPSTLLRRRPDIAASEHLLVAANANIGVSVANFFPQIGLTTFFGRASTELSEFSTGNNLWNVGGTLTGPLFQGGKLRAEYKISKAQFQEQLAAYEQTVVTAFADVSDALITKQKLVEQDVFNVQAVEALTSSVDLATQRYLNGKSSYFEVLQAQQELYPAQRAEAQTKAGELISVVQLYKALGGGWTNTPTATPAKTK